MTVEAAHATPKGTTTEVVSVKQERISPEDAYALALVLLGSGRSRLRFLKHNPALHSLAERALDIRDGVTTVAPSADGETSDMTGPALLAAWARSG